MENEKLENSEISEELLKKYRFRRRIIWGCAFAVLAVVVAYLVYCAVNKTSMGIAYYVLLSVAMFLFWLLTDVIAPIAVHAFDGRTQKQKSAYFKYAALEFLGYGGLVFFGLSAMSRNNSIYGAVVFLIATLNKRRFLDQYENPEEEEESEEENEETGMDDTENTSNEVPESGTYSNNTAVSNLSAAGRLARLQAKIDSETDSQEMISEEDDQE